MCLWSEINLCHRLQWMTQTHIPYLIKGQNLYNISAEQYVSHPAVAPHPVHFSLCFHAVSHFVSNWRKTGMLQSVQLFVHLCLCWLSSLGIICHLINWLYEWDLITDPYSSFSLWCFRYPWAHAGSIFMLGVWCSFLFSCVPEGVCRGIRCFSALLPLF